MATMKFLGIPYPITASAHGYFRSSYGVNQIKSDLLQLLLTNPGERCLTGETLIPLANGKELPIASLVGESAFWVYSFDVASNRVVPGLATAHKTLSNAEIMEVTLDNEQSVRCTPDHLWMLRDGTYMCAKYLKTGDLLMPLHRHLNTSKYERVYQPALGNYKETHLCFVDGKRLSGVKEVVHHKDLNKRNNAPDNLQWMTCEAHKKLHKEIRNAFDQKIKDGPEVREKLKAAWEKRRLKNHKVVSVINLNEREECYDLKVERYHNFAVSAGAFVHNCMLPTYGTPLKKLIFEQNDDLLATQAREVIAAAITAWEPRITVQQIEVLTTPDTTQLNPNDPQQDLENMLMIKILFFDPQNIQEVDEITLELPTGGTQ